MIERCIISGYNTLQKRIIIKLYDNLKKYMIILKNILLVQDKLLKPFYRAKQNKIKQTNKQQKTLPL